MFEINLKSYFERAARFEAVLTEVGIVELELRTDAWNELASRIELTPPTKASQNQAFEQFISELKSRQWPK